MGNGSSFGEQALVHNKGRNAKVICLSDCHFAILMKQDYNIIMKRHEEDKQRIEKEFLKKIPFF